MARPPAPPRRILLVRLSAFGDVVIATGLLHGLKRAYPDAEIDWLVQPEFASLLRTQPAIAAVQVWPRKDWGRLLRSMRWLTLWHAIRDFTRTLRAREYDWVIDAQGLLKSRALARLAGGRFRIGYDSKEPGRGWLHAVVPRHPEGSAPRRHIGDEHAPMLVALGGDGDCRPAIAATPSASDEPYLAAAPFTTRPQKHWPVAHWVALLGALTGAGHRVRLLGGPGDVDAALAIAARVRSPLLEVLAGKTSFVEAAAQLAGATAVVGVDTGLTHLGLALGRPTVALFGSTRPYAALRESEQGAVLFRDLPCAPCGRAPTCGGRFDCMTGLTPATVLGALTPWLPVRP